MQKMASDLIISMLNFLPDYQNIVNFGLIHSKFSFVLIKAKDCFMNETFYLEWDGFFKYRLYKTTEVANGRHHWPLRGDPKPPDHKYIAWAMVGQPHGFILTRKSILTKCLEACFCNECCLKKIPNKSLN